MEKDNQNGISVIVCNYNSSLKQILLTLSSIIKQEEILFEVLYCDDGSDNNFQNEISGFLKENNFTNFKLLCSDTNSGTIKNVIKGLKEAKFSHCKVIGAGDLFYDSSSARSAVDALGLFKCDFLFGNTCYFNNDEDLNIINRSNPVYLKCYNKGSYNQKMIQSNLLISEDVIGGVSLFAKTESLLHLLSYFEKYIKYTDDAVLIYAAFDGKTIYHVDKYLMFYEFGSGVSSPNNSAFKTTIRNEVHDIINKTIDSFDDGNNILIKRRRRIDRTNSRIKQKMLKFVYSPFKLKLFYIFKRVHKPKPDLSFFKECEGIANAQL